MNSSLHSLDKEVFIFLNRGHSELLDQLMFSGRNLLLWAPLGLLVVFIILKYRQNRQRPHVLITTIIFFFFIIVQLLLCVWVLPHFLEPLAQRSRPIYDSEFIRHLDLSKFSYLTRFDFFSAKVCAVFSISFFMIAFSEVSRWLKFSLLIWAIFISYNRIYIGAYYPSNVLVSDLIGIGIGLLAYRYYQYLKNYVLVI